jgi:hypothetical protein
MYCGVFVGGGESDCAIGVSTWHANGFRRAIYRITERGRDRDNDGDS